MKRSLSQVTFERIVAALQSYKRSDSLEVLLPAVAVLAEDASTHSLLRGVSLVAGRDKRMMCEAFQRDRSRGTWLRGECCMPRGSSGPLEWLPRARAEASPDLSPVSQGCASLFARITRKGLTRGASS